MNRYQLADALAPYRGIPGFDDALTRLLGGPIDGVPDSRLLAGHLNASETFLAVYLATSTHMALLEATSTGMMLSLSVPNSQIRRIVLLEDPETTRLTIEINADRSTLTGTLGPDGALVADIRSGGYEIVAENDIDRQSLRGLQAAFVAVTGVVA